MKNKDKLMLVPFVGLFYPLYVLYNDGNRPFNLTWGEFVLSLLIQTLCIIIPILLIIK